MLSQIAYTEFLSLPYVAWGGIVTYILFIATALIPILRKKYPTLIPFKWHQRIAITALIFATLHGILGLSIYF